MTLRDQADRIERSAAELWNTLTHGLGLVLSVIGAMVMLLYAGWTGDWRVVLGTGIFGASLIVLYLASTLYHAARRVDLKAKLRVFDHIAILYLIAGTYTPFALISVRGVWGTVMLVAIWALALYGTFLKGFSKHRYSPKTTLLYVAMGWLCVLFAGPMVASIPTAGLVWLAVGGLLYTGGIAFYLWERWPYAHGIWHLFVLGGSICHFVAVFGYAIPRVA